MSEVKLEITFDDSVWSELVELSRAQNDNTPAITVQDMVLRQLKTFLHGKVAGIDSVHPRTTSEPSKAQAQRDAGLRVVPPSKSDCEETR